MIETTPAKPTVMPSTFGIDSRSSDVDEMGNRNGEQRHRAVQDPADAARDVLLPQRHRGKWHDDQEQARDGRDARLVSPQRKAGAADVRDDPHDRKRQHRAQRRQGERRDIADQCLVEGERSRKARRGREQQKPVGGRHRGSRQVSVGVATLVGSSGARKKILVINNIMMCNDFMPRDIQADLLRTFIAVVETRGFASAATRLNRTQPGVSAHIRRLEGIVGRRLLDRNGGRRDVALTAHGERLLGYARRIIALNDEALDETKGDERASTIRFGVTEDFAANVLPNILARFVEVSPRVELAVETGMTMLMRKDVGRKFDLVLALQPVGTGAGDVLRRENLVWAAMQEEASRQSPVLLAIYPSACLYRQVAQTALDRQERPWRAAVTSHSFTTLHATMLQTPAVSVFPHCALPPSARVLTEQDGFPTLPQVEVALYQAPGASTCDAATRRIPRSGAADQPMMARTTKVVLITGAAHGIGRATARQLLDEGWLVGAVDLPGPELARAFGKQTRRVALIEDDIGDAAAAKRAVTTTIERFGQLDGVVSNAGIMIRKPIRQLTIDEWRRVLDVNLTAAFALAKAAERPLRQTNGAFVSIASTRARCPSGTPRPMRRARADWWR